MLAYSYINEKAKVRGMHVGHRRYRNRSGKLPQRLVASQAPDLTPVTVPTEPSPWLRPATASQA